MIQTTVNKEARVANEFAEHDTVGFSLILMTGAADLGLASEAIHAGVADFFPKDTLTADSLTRSINNKASK